MTPVHDALAPEMRTITATTVPLSTPPPGSIQTPENGEIAKNQNWHREVHHAAGANELP
jgi:hypothetical protein